MIGEAPPYLPNPECTAAVAPDPSAAAAEAPPPPPTQAPASGAGALLSGAVVGGTVYGPLGALVGGALAMVLGSSPNPHVALGLWGLRRIF